MPRETVKQKSPFDQHCGPCHTIKVEFQSWISTVPRGLIPVSLVTIKLFFFFFTEDRTSINFKVLFYKLSWSKVNYSRAKTQINIAFRLIIRYV